MIDRAFLAPDIVKSVMKGDQPIGQTAKWLGQNPLPSDWQAPAPHRRRTLKPPTN